MEKKNQEPFLQWPWVVALLFGVGVIKFMFLYFGPKLSHDASITDILALVGTLLGSVVLLSAFIYFFTKDKSGNSPDSGS